MTLNNWCFSFKKLITTLLLIPIQGFCPQFLIEVPSDTGFKSIVGVLEVTLNGNQIEFTYAPSQSANHPPDERMIFCPFYNHLECKTLPS